MSLQALGVNTNSQAALGIYDGQPEGMPPMTVDNMGDEKNKKPKKGKKKRKKNQEGVANDATPTKSDQAETNMVNMGN